MAILPIGFFMPLPLAMMIPFMGMQSAVMMKQAGENWQYGKRKQSSLTNEEFNKQTQVTIFESNQREIRQMIPTMEQSIKDMRGFQDFIIVEMIELMRRGLETGLGAIFGLTPEQSNEFFGGTNPPSSSTSSTDPVFSSGTDTGIFKSIADIQAMSNNEILFETQPNQITKYDEQTQAHMLTEKLARNISGSQETEVLETLANVRTVIWESFTTFLQWLTLITLKNVREGVFSDDSILQRKLEINFGSTFAIRTQSNTSDQRLREWQDNLNVNNQTLQKAISGGDSSTIRNAKRAVNISHTMIWIHQLIYSK